MATKTETSDRRTDAQRQKAAAEEIDTGLRALRRAKEHLTTGDGGEIAFAGQVHSAIEELEFTSRRLKEYAANGW